MAIKTRLILIGGVAGSGKTFIGREISRVLPNSIYIDKDTISRFFTDELLCLLGSTKNERESSVYLNKIRDLEYNTMMKQAFENLDLGKNVICSAPLLRELADRDWLRRIKLEAELSDAELFKIWVSVDIQTAKERLIERGAERDLGKLNNWSSYIASTKFSPPEGLADFYEIDNSYRAISPLKQQLNNLFDSLLPTA